MIPSEFGCPLQFQQKRDGQTDRLTDRPIDISSYRDAWAHLKKVSIVIVVTGYTQ